MNTEVVIPESVLRLMTPEDRRMFGKAGMTQEEIIAKVSVRLEKELHNQISCILNLRGIVFAHARMDRKSTLTEGWPDFSFAVRTKVGEILPVAIEAKMEGEDLSDDQKLMIPKMRMNGWRVLIVRSAEEFRLQLDSLILGSSIGK